MKARYAVTDVFLVVTKALLGGYKAFYFVAWLLLKCLQLLGSKALLRCSE